MSDTDEDKKPERKGFHDFALNKEYQHNVPRVEHGEVGSLPSARPNNKGKKQTTIQLKKLR